MSNAIDFEAFPKIPRLNRDIVVTEKIDGTNGALVIEDDRIVAVQSRSKFVTPGKGTDNFGFAGWAYKNADTLVALLGEGRHYGEWWGSGIQRGYGLTGDDKRFSLFNTVRWNTSLLDNRVAEGIGLYVVPELYRGPFSLHAIDTELEFLRGYGSLARPGFMDAEGIIVWHTAARTMFKVTLKNDEAPKSTVAA